MKNKILIKTILVLSIVFIGCSSSHGGSAVSEMIVSKENKDEKSNREEKKMIITSQTNLKRDIDYMRNIELSTVPENFYEKSTQQGLLETCTYDTKDYISSGNSIQKSAIVYLPYGYNQNNIEIRYNILYLQHGAYGDERTWMYEYGENFKNLIDNMIESKLIPPLIIIMPYLSSGNEWYHDTTSIFYSKEIKNDLMPVIESHYHTYALNTTDSGFAESRSHRAFGGFSAGGTTTWHVFVEGIDRFEYFLPMSGGLTLGGDGSTDVTDATTVANAALNSGYDKNEYYIFAATGTEDLAYHSLTSQIEAMKTMENAFAYTEEGFADGNLMYYTVEGNRHDYPYTYEYVFNGLQCLFA